VTDAVLEPLLQSPQLLEHAARLEGVSITAQSTVKYTGAAQSEAQNALSQDRVPRAYRGAVRDYFDDLK
jgi:hypothetical protein